MNLQAPFPWFGGKSRVAEVIWDRFGAVENYVEPFFGSGAVLLARPRPFGGVETVNDLDGFVANFWRAVQAAPEDVARWLDWPVNETDLHARHYWLVTEGRDRLASALGDPARFDAQVAGWWCWGACSWIGGGWCSGEGPWSWDGAAWVNRNAGQGINRKLPHLGDAGTGDAVLSWMRALAARLRGVRVANGDWSRVTGDSVTWRHGRTAVFLDPPYDLDLRARTYAVETAVGFEVRAWAIEAGQRDDMLICLAGYDGEHEMPPDWTARRWKTKGGYGSQGDGRGRKNAARETLWFSPACRPAKQELLL